VAGNIYMPDLTAVSSDVGSEEFSYILHPGCKWLKENRQGHFVLFPSEYRKYLYYG
jgi:hypothetical protein